MLLKLMRMNKWFVLLSFLAVILSGCASSGPSYESKMVSFIGLPVEHVLAQMGKPQRSYQLPDGNMVLEYQSFRSVNKYVAPPYVNQATRSGDFIPPETYISTPDMYRKILWCRTRFISDQKNTIISWTHEGNDCRP
jgi:hypothetical protein